MSCHSECRAKRDPRIYLEFVDSQEYWYTIRFPQLQCLPPSLLKIVYVVDCLGATPPPPVCAFATTKVSILQRQADGTTTTDAATLKVTTVLLLGAASPCSVFSFVQCLLLCPRRSPTGYASVSTNRVSVSSIWGLLATRFNR